MSILRTYVAKLRWCRHFPQSKLAILYLPLRTAHFAAAPIVDFAGTKIWCNLAVLQVSEKICNIFASLCKNVAMENDWVAFGCLRRVKVR